MRNLIFGSSVATSGVVPAAPIAANEGKVGFAYLNNGILTFDDGTNIKDKGYIVLVRTADHGGNVVLPFYKHHFKHVKGVYQAATTFAGTVDISGKTITPGETYTIIAVRKGVKFNERNRWTASVVAGASDTATTIGDKLAAYFNANSEALGLSVVNTSGSLAFTAAVAGEDYALVPADDLYGIVPTITTAGIPAYADGKYVKDLADKAAADVGFEYTYQDDARYLYPNYPAKLAASGDDEFTIYTLNFSERREVKTLDDVVNQVVQIIFNDDEFTDLDAVLDALDGIVEEEEGEDDTE